MRKIILFLTFIAMSYISLAQDSLKTKRNYKNKVSLHWTYSGYPKLMSAFQSVKSNPNAPTQYGIDAERKIYRNINAVVGFAKWNQATWFFKSSLPEGHAITGPDPVFKKGGIEYRKKYKMVDLLVSYKYNKLKRHEIDVGIGPSYYWGVNTIIDTIEINVFESFMLTSDHKADYFGMVYMFDYDYLIFKNRIAIGIDIKYRKYTGYRIAQVDYSPHIAFIL